MDWSRRAPELAPCLLGVLRIGAAVLFLQHGTAKLFGVPHVAMFDGLTLFSLLGAAGIIEVVGGLLLLFGLFTRPAAVVLAVEMAVAYGVAHAGKALLPIHNQGELALLYMLVFIYFAAAGPGRFALDRAGARPEI
ncbi:DoxX family protein [Methylosinus sp. Sm6]|uniref:DoxX family protein n=1 Tax=Methylosinus sp. Sm6 TaxID=2866948 RepID=UPI001C990C82|nr:DoxX family protein [Methylosinus sp. Sm6]MBY6242986.1 DoxX family protein [Methylosinus sp. Sm6]